MSTERWRKRIEIMKQHKHDYITIDFDEVELALAVVEAAKEAVPHLNRYHGIDEHNLRRAVEAFEACPNVKCAGADAAWCPAHGNGNCETE